MTSQQIADMLQAFDNEFKAGDIGIWNYKKKLGTILDLAVEEANKVAHDEERIVILEALVAELQKHFAA